MRKEQYEKLYHTCDEPMNIKTINIIRLYNTKTYDISILMKYWEFCWVAFATLLLQNKFVSSCFVVARVLHWKI